MGVTQQHILGVDVVCLLGHELIGGARRERVAVEVVVRGCVHGKEGPPVEAGRSCRRQLPEESDLFQGELFAMPGPRGLCQWLARRGAPAIHPVSERLVVIAAHGERSLPSGAVHHLGSVRPYETKSPTTSNRSKDSAANTASSAGQFACKSEITRARIDPPSPPLSHRHSALTTHCPGTKKLLPAIASVGVISPRGRTVGGELHRPTSYLYPGHRGVSRGLCLRASACMALQTTGLHLQANRRAQALRRPVCLPDSRRPQRARDSAR